MLVPLPVVLVDCTREMVIGVTGKAVIGSTMFSVSVATRMDGGDPDHATFAPVATASSCVMLGRLAERVVKVAVVE